MLTSKKATFSFSSMFLPCLVPNIKPSHLDTFISSLVPKSFSNSPYVVLLMTFHHSVSCCQ